MVGSPIQSRWIERTTTSRNAGSSVPPNVRCSLYRYETEMYFSGFPKVFAEACGVPETTNLVLGDRDALYLGEV